MIFGARCKKDLIQSLGEYADTRLKRDLLFFWNKYPYAKFAPAIIAHALGCNRRVEMEEALEALVKDELVEKDTRLTLPVYCLTADREKRQRVLALSARSN